MTERTHLPITAAQAVRFWAKVDNSGPCWLWTGSQNGSGYGEIRVAGVKLYAHRVGYELLVGPIPTGLVIDHLCRVRNCVNPEHLEPVTPAENTRRVPPRTSCPRGHAYTPDNTYFTARNPTTPICRTCHRYRERIRKNQRRSA